MAPGMPPARVIAHAPPKDFLAASNRIVKGFPLSQHFPFKRGVKRFC